MATSAIFRITDGTDAVNLLNQSTGFHLESWRQVPLPSKGEGVYQSSPIADGRRLVSKQWDNTLDRFDLSVNGVGQDAVIYDISLLFTLLEKAAQYWTTDWQQEPVWIEARAGCETNTRYAHVVNWRVPELASPYSGAFLEHLTAMGDVTLLIEHTGWLEYQPGTGAAVGLSAVETYDGRNLGNVNDTGNRDPTTAEEEVFITNCRKVANLTDIYYYDASIPIYSANLMDAALPFAFLPAVPAVGDIVYFGIDTSITDSGPFNSLVFDIGTAITNVTTIIWEYYNGAWVTLTTQDNTRNDGLLAGGVVFDTISVKSVNWDMQYYGDWITVAINGITGYWVRARITAIGVNPTPPVQQNRDIYSIIWPYVEIQNTEIYGDISSIARIRTIIQSDKDGGTLPNLTWFNRVIIGLRKLSRGTNYVPYINLADEQNPAGITVSAVNSGAFGTSVIAPTGRRIVSTNPGAVLTIVSSIDIISPLVNEYHGAFRIFLRARQTSGGAGDIGFAIKIGYTGVSTSRFFFESDTVYLKTTTLEELLDFGKVEISTVKGQDNAYRIRIFIYVIGNGVSDAALYDLILFPVDEWAIDCRDEIKDSESNVESRGVIALHTYIDIDGITNPSNNKQCLLKFRDTDEFSMEYNPITNNYPILQVYSNQRYWFLVSQYNSTNDVWKAIFNSNSTISVIDSQRYIAMRGRG